MRDINPMIIVIAAAFLASVLCLPSGGVQTVDVPHSGVRYNASGNTLRHFNGSNNATKNVNDGVCYTEVPTASIAKDPSNVPRGNGSTPALSRVRTCCAGYKRNAHYFPGCDPICTRGCVNGVCTAPETCTCFAGHAENLAGFCVSTCPTSCQNGWCSGGECVCDPGYVLETNRKFCVPVCRDNCGGHGNCTGPNICDCPEQYPLGETGLCMARCPNCEHGDCVGPNECHCHKGYEKDKQGACVPVCSKGCQNGICAAPEVCACQYGFNYDEALGQCQPKCTTPCYNALCTGPETCTCKPGYVKDERNPVGNVCQPHCPDGCPNGVCSNPNYCICNYGFVKDKSVKNSQKCVKIANKGRN